MFDEYPHAATCHSKFHGTNKLVKVVITAWLKAAPLSSHSNPQPLNSRTWPDHATQFAAFTNEKKKTGNISDPQESACIWIFPQKSSQRTTPVGRPRGGRGAVAVCVRTDCTARLAPSTRRTSFLFFRSLYACSGFSFFGFFARDSCVYTLHRGAFSPSTSRRSRNSLIGRAAAWLLTLCCWRAGLVRGVV